MFLGRFDHTVDAKARLAIPAKFRTALQGGLVVTRGLDPCLAVYPRAEWEPLAARVSALSIADPNARALRRIFFSEAADGELDRQGRLVIPVHLRELAGIETEVVVVGMNTFIEVWSKERWRDVEHQVDREAGQIAEALVGLI